MAKTFKKFREQRWDGEWDDDDINSSKKEKLENRRQKRRQKVESRFSAFENNDDE
jgi:hypothetical protein